MKKLLFLGLGSALMFTLGGVGPAAADNGPHISGAQAAGTAVAGTYGTGIQIAGIGADRCAACHRAHTAKAEYLLVQAQPALCYTCHRAGLGANTDVANGISGSGAALRGGGFNTAAIGSGLASKEMGALVGPRIATVNQLIPALATPVTTTSKHNINGGAGDAGTAWGNGSLNTGVGKSLTLECGSCHDPHGNRNYRILKPMPVDSQYVLVPAVADNPATTSVNESLSPATNVNIPDVTAYGYTTTNYWLTGDATSPLNTAAQITAGNAALTGTASAAPAAPDGYIQNIAAWCTTCHTRYLAGSGSYKTPNQGYPAVAGATGTVDPTFMYRHRSDANYKQGAANCITCHVSHGSNASVAGRNSSTVTNPGDTTAVATDSRLLRVDNRGVCLMCHNV